MSTKLDWLLKRMDAYINSNDSMVKNVPPVPQWVHDLEKGSYKRVYNELKRFDHFTYDDLEFLEQAAGRSITHAEFFRANSFRLPDKDLIAKRNRAKK